jgi:hypothetical protein
VRRRLVAAAGVIVMLVAVPAARAVAGAPVLGPQKILVVLATWGPTPFARDDVRHIVFDEADAFYRKTSFGKASLTGAVTPWLHAFGGQPPCNANSIREPAVAAVRAAGYEPASYDAVIYIHPDAACAWSGATYAGVVFLDGEVTPYLVEHELGHAFGLAHANTTACLSHSCATLEYGDPYDTMGRGAGDFSAYAKARLGWLTHVTRVVRNGVHPLAALERESASTQALVVTTAQDQYWIEYRTERAHGANPGVLVHVSPSPDLRTPITGSSYNALLANPGRRGRPELLPGDSFAYPRVFRLTVLRADAAVARVRFSWIDRVPPAAPRVTSRVVGGEIRVDIDGTREAGSGVAHYDVWVDRHAPLSFGADSTDEPVRVGRPLPGTHTVHVVAVDRAGNRSRPALLRIHVP